VSKLTKIEAVKLAITKWRKIALGVETNEMCALCDYTRKNPYEASDCNKCPLKDKWPVAIHIKSKKRTTAYCQDKDSAWGFPGTGNAILIVNALEKLLKELEVDKTMSKYKEHPDYIDRTEIEIG
jgi:hypothetical protein